MRRYPLAIVTGEDGVHYDHLLFIHGDIAPRRFSGNHKDFGVNTCAGSRRETELLPARTFG
jgi:hypothetical protein